VKQVLRVLNLYKKDTINIPSTLDGWRVLSDGFEAIAGLPNCCLAIDGSLIMLKR
jgi:hypothetical protein